MSSSQEESNAIESNDAPQLEYDDHDMYLVAEQEGSDDDDDNDEFQYDQAAIKSQSGPQTVGINTSHITPEGIIDEDFESELGTGQIADLSLPDHSEMRLMKKIEEYGIFQHAGDDRFGRKIIVCFACNLPTEDQIKQTEFQSLEQFHQALMDYITKTFDLYVLMDYIIIYFHYGLNSNNRPSYGWLMRTYRQLDRKYKKNLKGLFIVHPTRWIKFFWPFVRSIISGKFSKKLIYIDDIIQLDEFVRLKNLLIPNEIKQFDLINARVPAAMEMIPTNIQWKEEAEENVLIPLILQETTEFIKRNGLNEPGLFCRVAPIPLIREVQFKYSEGQPVEWNQYSDVHLAATILKLYLRNLPEPLLTHRLYPELLGLSALSRYNQFDLIRDLIMEKLPERNYRLLKYLIEFLNLVSSFSDTNLMTATELSFAFGSNLGWSDDFRMNTFSNYSLINSLTEILISRYTELFLK